MTCRPIVIMLLITVAPACDEGAGNPGGSPQGPHLELLGTQSVGPRPNLMTPSPDGGVILVGDVGVATVYLLRADDGALLDTFAIGEGGTLGMATASRLRDLLYVAFVEGSTVLVHDLDSGLEDREPLLVGQRTNLVGTSRDGRFVIATAFDAGLVRVFDADFDYSPVQGSLILGERPAGLVVTRARPEDRAHVVGLDRGTVFTIDFNPSTATIVDSVTTVPGSTFIALSPDERIAYVSGGDDRVHVVDLDGSFVTERILVGSEPLGLDVSADGRFVVVANSGSGSLSLIDIAAVIVVDDLQVGNAPTDVLFTRSGLVLVTLQGEGRVAILTVAPGSEP